MTEIRIDSEMPIHLRAEDWQRPDSSFWRGRVEGHLLGTGVSVIFYATDIVGAGPVLHVHPYDEMFIVREGRALVTIGEKQIEAERGDVLLGPANVPHRFENLGPGRLETTDIHLSERIIQTDLE